MQLLKQHSKEEIDYCYLDAFYDELSFSQVASRNSNLDDEVGSVQNIAVSQLQDFSDHVYACGSPGMIETARMLLIEYGLEEKNFFQMLL